MNFPSAGNFIGNTPHLYFLQFVAIGIIGVPLSLHPGISTDIFEVCLISVGSHVTFSRTASSSWCSIGCRGSLLDQSFIAPFLAATHFILPTSFVIELIYFLNVNSVGQHGWLFLSEISNHVIFNTSLTTSDLWADWGILLALVVPAPVLCLGEPIFERSLPLIHDIVLYVLRPCASTTMSQGVFVTMYQYFYFPQLCVFDPLLDCTSSQTLFRGVGRTLAPSFIRPILYWALTFRNIRLHTLLSSGYTLLY